MSSIYLPRRDSKRLVQCLVAATVLWSFTVSAAQQQVELPLVADTYVYEFAPDNNYGSTTTTFVGGQSPFRMATLLRYDISPIPPGAVITQASATFRITSTDHTGDFVLTLRRRTAPWSEYGATWASAGVDSDLILGPFALNADVTYPIAVDGPWLTAVRDWVDNPSQNHGVSLETAIATDAYTAFSTNEAAQGVRLYVTYETCDEPGTFALLHPADGQELPATTLSTSLSWEPAPLATDYRVYVNGALHGTTTGTSKGLPVDPGDQVQWYVVAENACGQRSSASRSFSVASVASLQVDVQDAQGVPVPGSDLRLRLEKDGQLVQEVTPGSSNHTFTGLDDGSGYRLHVYLTDQLVASEDLVLAPGANVQQITAAPTAQLRIRVLASDGQSSLEGATVQLQAHTGTTWHQGTSGEDGFVHWPGEPLNIYPAAPTGASWTAIVQYEGQVAAQQLLPTLVTGELATVDIVTTVAPTPSSLADPFLTTLRDIAELAWGPLEGRYESGEKHLFAMSVGLDVPAPIGRVDVGGPALIGVIDLDDLLAITPEGQEDWCTAYIDGEVGLSVGYSPIFLGLSLIKSERTAGVDDQLRRAELSPLAIQSPIWSFGAIVHDDRTEEFSFDIEPALEISASLWTTTWNLWRTEVRCSWVREVMGSALAESLVAGPSLDSLLFAHRMLDRVMGGADTQGFPTLDPEAPQLMRSFTSSDDPDLSFTNPFANQFVRAWAGVDEIGDDNRGDGWVPPSADGETWYPMKVEFYGDSFVEREYCVVVEQVPPGWAVEALNIFDQPAGHEYCFTHGEPNTLFRTQWLVSSTPSAADYAKVRLHLYEDNVFVDSLLDSMDFEMSKNPVYTTSGNLLNNASFESGTEGWNGMWSCNLSSTNAHASHGAFAVQVSQRPGGWCGPQQTVLASVPEGTYQLAADVLTLSTSCTDSAQIVLELWPDDGSAATYLSTPWTPLTGGAFVSINEELTLAPPANLGEVRWRVQTNCPDDLVVDNAKFVPASSTPPSPDLFWDFRNGSIAPFFGNGCEAVSGNLPGDSEPSLECRNRVAAWAGPMVSLVDDLVSGATYLFEAMAASGGGAPLKMTLHLKTSTGEESYLDIAGWQQASGFSGLSGTQLVQWLDGDLTLAQLYLQSDGDVSPIYLKEVRITRVD